MKRSAIAICFLGLACTPPPEVNEVSMSAAIAYYALDPATTAGEVLGEDPMVSNMLGMLDCANTNPIIINLTARTQGSHGFGRVMMAYGLVESGEPCDGSGVVSTQGISYTAEGDRYVLQGPASVEGQNVEGHLPIGALQNNRISFLPDWWSIVLSGDDTVLPDGTTLTRLAHGTLSTLWNARDADAAVYPDGSTLLDRSAASGRQPDVDLDFDGIERFIDDDGDGRWDSCIDGGGGDRVVGDDCLDGVRFPDSYQIRVLLRFEETRLVDPLPLPP